MAPPPPAPPSSPWYKRLASRLSQSDAILAAMVGALGVIAGSLVTAMSAEKADSGKPEGEPRISISSPADEGSIPEVQDPITVTGEVSNLGPGQTVWVFDRAADANDLWTHDGPCPVNEDGEFICPSFPLTTSTTDPAGKEHRLYVAIVDDEDQRGLIEYRILREREIWEPMQGRTEPPGLAHDHVVVQKPD